jgi:putative ABC transport system substrate-binding protein
VAPLKARAQTERMPRVAVLTPYAESDPEAQAWFKSFVQGMRAVGWTDGSNIRIDARWGGGEVDRIQGLAKELVELQPEVVFAMTTRRSTQSCARPTPYRSCLRKLLIPSPKA